MRRLFIYLSNKHEVIFKMFIVALAVVLITMMMPRAVYYEYEFNRGEAWKYADLFAPFEFTVLKPADSVALEEERVRLLAPLYFRAEEGQGQRVVTEFSNSFLREWSRLTGDTARPPAKKDYYRILQAGVTAIERIYAHGLLQKDDFLDEFYTKETYLVHGAVITVFDPAAAFDHHTAKELLTSVADSLGNEHGALLVDLIPPLLSDNIRYDDGLTGKFLDERMAAVSMTRGLVRKGELIVSRNQPVSDVVYDKLRSLKRAYQSTVTSAETPALVFIGRLCFIAICISMLMIFLATLRKDIYADNVKVMLMISLILLISFAFTQVIKHNVLSVYLVPCCILPIIMRVFFDTRLALFTHILTMMFLATAAPNAFDFLFMQSIAGMVTIFSFTHMRRRAQLFISVSLIFISYLVSYVVLDIIHGGSFDEGDLVNVGWIMGNALITLFSYPLIYITERVFKLTSDVSLLEMSDLNSPLLRELSLKAPGTFQHSMQVANLAEAAIYRIGGNALLVRAGSLYHDIGKMDMPLYFIENQSSQVNPHDELPFEESAAVIISHVIRGIEKAKKRKLPDLVIDFIRTHHGTTMVQYFYQSYLKNYPEKIVDEEDFRYPGPLPFSRETAVLMMADSVEAASRSLSSHDAESLSKLVDQIIDNLIAQNQFVNCGITFRDISEIRRIFKKMLMSFYHVRVEYPIS